MDWDLSIIICQSIIIISKNGLFIQAHTFTNLYRLTIYLNLACYFHHIQCQVANRSCMMNARLWQTTHCHILVPNCFHLSRYRYFNCFIIVGFRVLEWMQCFLQDCLSFQIVSLHSHSNHPNSRHLCLLLKRIYCMPTT